MTLLKLHSIAAELVKEGKSNEEIRKALFDTKGARLSQIKKVMALVS